MVNILSNSINKCDSFKKAEHNMMTLNAEIYRALSFSPVMPRHASLWHSYTSDGGCFCRLAVNKVTIYSRNTFSSVCKN